MATDEPLLLIAFNRPDRFEQLIERLRRTKPSRLFVAIDGPRPDHPTDAERVARTRALVQSIDWPADVQTLFQESNLGCGLGVTTAITWFFSQVERGIILEDDILPRDSFFGFCSELLDRYADDPRVLAISGCNFVLPEFITTEGPYRFSRVPHIWGWASWRRSWDLHRLDIEGWQRELPTRRLWRSAGRSLGGFLFWKANFDLVARGEIDTWDYQFTFAGFANNALTATSNVNLVDNVGWGADATHTTDERPAFLRTSEDIALPLTQMPVVVDERADAWSRRVVFSATFSGLAGKSVRYVIGKFRAVSPRGGS